MLEPLIYVDQSRVRRGKLEELRAALPGLVDLVDRNEPRILSYQVYFTEDGSRLTIVHVHEDPSSLEFHMKVAGPAFPPFAALIRMERIDVYGNPGDDLLERLREKARMLGSGIVEVHRPHAGFARFALSGS